MTSEKRNELKKVIRAILIAEKSQGMPLRELERKYSDMEGKSMPLCGYPDTAALLYSLSDTVFTELVRGQLHVYPVETDKTKHMANLVRNTDTRRRRVRGSVNRSLDRTIIPGFIGGVDAKKLNHSDRNNKPNRKPQDCRNYLHQQQNGKARQSAHTTTRPIQSDRKQSNDSVNDANKFNGQNYADIDDVDVVKLDDSDDDSVHDYAEFKCGDKVKLNIARFLLTFDEEDIYLEPLPMWELNEIFEPGRAFRLFLSQVQSPYKFWFQLNDHLELIDSLMDRLNTFHYQDPSKLAQTAIPDEFLEIGMTCAALYNSEWHRGKIVDILENSVVVFFVDYGTVSEIYKTDTRFLDKQFAAQPMFAFRGCLDNVRPKSGIWTYQEIEDFLEHLKKFFTVPILGKPTLLNLPERTVYLDLTDTTGRRDVDIGKALIARNNAYVTRKLLFNYQQRHYSEVYPSFESLEDGSYPSFGQIQAMMQQEIDFLARETTIVIPEMYGYQTIE